MRTLWASTTITLLAIPSPKREFKTRQPVPQGIYNRYIAMRLVEADFKLILPLFRSVSSFYKKDSAITIYITKFINTLSSLTYSTYTPLFLNKPLPTYLKYFLTES